MATALSMPVLIGMLGIGVDVGTWYVQQGELQTTADVVALGAARHLADNGVSVAMLTPIAQADAVANGFSSAAGDTMSLALASGNTQVQVTVTRQANRYFTKLFSHGSVALSATSVGGLTQTQSTMAACVLALDPKASIDIDVENMGSISATNCTVASNSTSSQSIYVRNGSITAGAVVSAGGAVASSNGQSTISPTPQTYAAPTADPYASLQAPAIGSCDHTNFALNWAANPQTIYPGTYCGGLAVQNGAKVIFSPGLYVITNGDLNVTGGSTITSGNGVSFYLGGSKPGRLNLQNYTNTTWAMSAMSSGWMKGVLVYQDRSAPSTGTDNSVVGGSTFAFQGAMYFP
ncbi:MAG TPA: pilus assembly protein TadG-related protein, partial [Stellaceae bacterium]